MVLNDIKLWLEGIRKVTVKGNLVLCGTEIYSYQMKIGEKYQDLLYLIDRADSPSVTTSKHLGLVRNAAREANVPVITTMHWNDIM